MLKLIWNIVREKHYSFTESTAEVVLHKKKQKNLSLSSSHPPSLSGETHVTDGVHVQWPRVSTHRRTFPGRSRSQRAHQSLATREREGEGGTKTSAMRLDDGKSRQEMESRKERRSSCWADFLFLRALTYYLFSYCVQNSRTNVNFYMAHPYYLLR
jgi:hypothetical protein